MAEAETTTYVKLGREGQLIEREAHSPSDHVNFKGTGWVLKDSAAGKRVTSPKKTDDVSGLSAASVTAHAARAQLDGESVTPPTASRNAGNNSKS